MKRQPKMTWLRWFTKSKCSNVILVMCVMLSTAGVVIGQDPFQIVDNSKPKQQEAQVAGVTLSDIERWVFGSSEQAAIDARQKKWALFIDALTAVCDLSTEQKARLHALADLDTFQIEFGYRQVVQQFKENTKPGERLGGQQFSDLWRQIGLVSQQVKAPLGYGNAIFSKYLESLLNSDQWDKYKKWESERLRKKYEDYVRIWVVQFEAVVPLTQEQREKVVAKLLECDPPDRIFGYYGALIVLHVLSSVPPSQREEWFSPHQCQMIQKLIDANDKQLRSLRVCLPKVKVDGQTGGVGQAEEGK